jgi:hypothetical protein
MTLALALALARPVWTKEELEPRRKRALRNPGTLPIFVRFTGWRV